MRRPVHQPVHLRDDARGPAGPGVLGLAADALDQRLAQAVGREDEMVEARAGACSR